MKFLSRLRRRQIVVAVVALVIVTAGAFVVLRGSSGPESTLLDEDQQLIPVRRGDLVDAITVTGSVSFPERENMTFGSDGVVEDVMVKEGQRVSAGDLIATLDAETVARLEREVTDARAGVSEAQADLDDLVEPPSLRVVEAEHRVAVAKVALNDAVESLDSIVSPGSLQLAQAESRVVAATLDLGAAEQALEDAVGPVPAIELAQARMRVTDAEMALADLEGTHTRLEQAQAEVRVADAEAALHDAIEARDEYMDGPSQEDLKDAAGDVAMAETELVNAAADLKVVEREWATRSEEAREALDLASDTYAETFKEWLGIDADLESMDPDYETALSEFGIDLNVLFSVPDRFSGLEYGASALPEDDPSTAWNETQVYVWLHFSTHDLVPTCDRDSLPTFGICIEEEFRVAGEAYQNSVDGIAEVESQSSNAIASARARIDRAETALRRASEGLRDLEDLPDPLVAEQLKVAARVAAESLVDARKELADLAQPSDLQVANTNHRIEVARAEVEGAREKLEDLVGPRDPDEITDLEVRVALARAALEEARADLDELTTGVDHPGYAVAKLAVEVARETLAEEREKLANLTGGPDPIELALLQSRLDAARTLLAESEQRLDDATLEAPWKGFVSRVEARSGREVKATDIVAVLVDTSVVEVDGTVDEVDVLRVRVDAIAEVRMDALPDRKIRGTVSFVGAEASSDEGVVSYPVRVRIDLPPELKAPEGLSAVASITISEHRDVLLLPATAIRGSFTHPTVNLMLDGQVVETPVTLAESDDFWTAVTDGLKEGDIVVVESDLPIPELAGLNGGVESQP